MLTRLRIATGILLLATCGLATAQPQGDFATGGPDQCLECHDYGPDSPVHPVIAGSHGEAIMRPGAERRGCEDCHGPSADHAAAPTRVAPAISFGPRWTTSPAAQDTQCLACHEENIAQHWQDSLHMLNNLTCVTCHDIHAEEDRVLFEKQQAEVCTVCHKAQKQGIHGMQRRAARNPPCSTCHNPHDHEPPETELLRNDSAGCTHCHDLERMATRKRVSDRAKRSHARAMSRAGTTCLRCHEGVAHAAADSVAPMRPVAAGKRMVTLFYPGMADSDWLLEAHPGSQPLRQGAPCQRCHRGDEVAMGESQSGGRFEPVARHVEVAFRRDEETLYIDLQWEGAEDDATLAFMWGAREAEAIRRGGCFAACHSDLPGMSADRGQGVDKYLLASRAQRAGLGQPPILRDDADLRAIADSGHFGEIWRIELHSGEIQRSRVLAGLNWEPAKLISINKSFAGGRWHVAIERAMIDTQWGISFDPENKYTFGLSLNGADNPAGRHWVSLPMTLGFGSDDTEFSAE